jgi:transcriptional regulator with XRE-family HTH domain
MEIKDKENRKLRFGIALKKFMEKAVSDNSDSNTIEQIDDQKRKSLSFRKLETNSGIRHASIVEIVNGKKNAAWSTVDALLEGLDITLSEFAIVYDKITEKEIVEYKREIEKKKQERNKKQKKNSSKSAKQKK